MEIVETSLFTRQIKELIEDESYAELQLALVRRPDLGDLIPGSGGLRKVRWSQAGRGKRGGIRVIYYWYSPDDLIYMLLAYAKSTQENLTQEQLKILRKLVEEEFGSGSGVVQRANREYQGSGQDSAWQSQAVTQFSVGCPRREGYSRANGSFPRSLRDPHRGER
jgi:hypothetical protein